jgi:hypothetical protein
MTTMRDDGMRAGVYIGCVAAAGAALAGWSLLRVVQQGAGPRLLAWAAIGVLTVLAGSLSVRVPVRDCRVSFSDAFIFMSIVVFGPALATLTGLVDGLAASTRRRGTWVKRLFNAGSMAISTHLAARLFDWAVPDGGLWGSRAFSPIEYLVPLTLVAGTLYAVNTALVAGVLALKDGVPFLATFQDTTPWTGTAYLLGAASVGLAVLAARDLGLVTFVALLPFPAIVYVTFRSWLGKPLHARKGD